MRTRTTILITAGVVGAAVGGVAIGAAINDPDVGVDTVELVDIEAAAEPTVIEPTASPPIAADETGDSGTSATTANTDAGSDVAATSAPGGSAAVVQEVDGLEQLSGVLRSGEDADDWYVLGVEVDFGPEPWMWAAPAFADYDGDGTAEPLLTELRDLEGREVTLGVRYDIDDDRDDADVFTVDGLAYRDATGGAAPWQTAAAGSEASRDEIVAAAQDAVGAGSVAIDVDRETEDGWSGWDVEVRAADGQVFEVDLGLAGNVVDVRPYQDGYDED
ncbi:MAG: PepSY domain-containing protein [Ilumatobacter sp.]|uniref:PepSY domain-containing protein n=1 Tax=Ilumatobacter sp. TaxID=1967498 RepID=UPI00391A9336